MSAPIVTTYDVKLEIEGVRLPDMLVMTIGILNTKGNVLRTTKHLKVSLIMLL